jgi:PucR C-terminal helix-turn-helix domain/GGDEF-like domain
MTATNFGELVDLLDAQVDDMVEEILARYAEEFPDWGPVARPELVDEARQVSTKSLHAEIAALREGRLPDELPVPDANFGRATARLGAPVSNLSWGFRAGHAAQWRRWLELVDAREREPVRRFELLQRASEFFFAYADRMIQMVSEEYTRERERLLRTREQRRFHLVSELLGGAEIDSTALDYDLNGWHVGLVIWGPRAADAAHAVARSHGARTLMFSVVHDTFWGWLGTRQAPADDLVDRIAVQFSSDRARLAAGAVLEGSTGFRATHQQARDAHRIALATSRSVTRYADVALTVLAAQDESAARAFIQHELGGIDASDPRSSRLRATLDAYLANGLNAAATATALGVHEQTVANRLRAIEQRTGCPVAGRHAELTVALRLSEFLS